MDEDRERITKNVNDAIKDGFTEFVLFKMSNYDFDTEETLDSLHAQNKLRIVNKSTL